MRNNYRISMYQITSSGIFYNTCKKRSHICHFLWLKRKKYIPVKYKYVRVKEYILKHEKVNLREKL